MNFNDIVNILVRRDGITRGEAFEIIADCKDEIDNIIADGGTLDELENTIEFWLGLEPDYLDLFLE